MKEAILNPCGLSEKRRKKRATCACAAYPWPHRPRGGLCRWPHPPLDTFKGKAGVTAPVGMRRRSAIRRRLMRRYAFHPILDRELIRRWLPKLYAGYCRRHGLPHVALWFGGYIPAMRVTAEGPRNMSVFPAVQANWEQPRVDWRVAFRRDARRREKLRCVRRRLERGCRPKVSVFPIETAIASGCGSGMPPTEVRERGPSVLGK
jgi:hypothetical protein